MENSVKQDRIDQLNILRKDLADRMQEIFGNYKVVSEAYLFPSMTYTEIAAVTGYDQAFIGRLLGAITTINKNQPKENAYRNAIKRIEGLITYSAPLKQKIEDLLKEVEDKKSELEKEKKEQLEIRIKKDKRIDKLRKRYSPLAYISAFILIIAAIGIIAFIIIANRYEIFGFVDQITGIERQYKKFSDGIANGKGVFLNVDLNKGVDVKIANDGWYLIENDSMLISIMENKLIYMSDFFVSNVVALSKRLKVQNNDESQDSSIYEKAVYKKELENIVYLSMGKVRDEYEKLFFLAPNGVPLTNIFDCIWLQKAEQELIAEAISKVMLNEKKEQDYLKRRTRDIYTDIQRTRFDDFFRVALSDEEYLRECQCNEENKK